MFPQHHTELSTSYYHKFVHNIPGQVYGLKSQKQTLTEWAFRVHFLYNSASKIHDHHTNGNIIQLCKSYLCQCIKNLSF
jgi:hypothetical protein